MQDDLKRYRDQVVEADQKSVEAFDKTVLTLSAGGLGLSLTFVSDIVGCENVVFTTGLEAAWGLWIASLAMTLTSFYFSHLALRKTIRQIDDGEIQRENPGGKWTPITNVLNATSGIAFLCGLVFIVVFISKHIGV